MFLVNLTIPRIRETCRSLLTRPPQLCNYGFNDSWWSSSRCRGIWFAFLDERLFRIPVRLVHSPLDAPHVLYLLFRMVKRICEIVSGDIERYKRMHFLCITYLF